MDGVSGKPQDALDAILRELAPSAAHPGPDANVPIAFAAGWQAAGGQVGEAMLRATVAKLRAPLQAADQNVDALVKAQGPDAEKALGDQLAAADFRLGKAFELGCALRRIDAPTQLREQHTDLHTLLSQLGTALPPNAGHSVRDSLDMWAAALGKDAHGELDVRAQLELWRTLLSGEKAAKDMLELTDYVGVADGVAREVGRLVVRGVRHFWPLLLAAVALLAVGIWLILGPHAHGTLAAGITSVVAGLGLSWRGIGGSLGRAVARVEEPAWAAQVDRAVAFAITRPLPDGLLAAPPKGTLLAGLKAWRRAHKRPADQHR